MSYAILVTGRSDSPSLIFFLIFSLKKKVNHKSSAISQCLGLETEVKWKGMEEQLSLGIEFPLFLCEMQPCVLQIVEWRILFQWCNSERGWGWQKQKYL